MRLIVMSALWLAACATPAPTPEAPSNQVGARHHSAAAPSAERGSVERGRYLGAHVGVAIHHIGGPSRAQRLPDGLETLSAINVADGWHFTIARRGADLTILLIDDRGVVVDDVTLSGRGGDTIIVGDCPESFIGVAAAGACETAELARADVTWDRRGRSLVSGDAQTCSCELLRL